MELTEAVLKRRMVRAFTPDPLDDDLLLSLLDTARRAPSAGNTQATSFLVLRGADALNAYWDTTLPEPRRSAFRWQGLLEAPALIVITTDPSAYVSRYAEADKARPGLGESSHLWPVPYWWVDAGAVIQNLLLLVTNAGLGACLFGLFDHEEAVAERFGVAPNQRLVATIAVGHKAPDEPGRSAKRTRPDLADVVHFDHWDKPAPPSS